MLELRNVTLRLPDAILLAPFSLALARGEIVTLMGPSGSGKSSLLSAIAGSLSRPFAMSGQILIDGRDVTNVPPEQRHLGRLFQDDLLFPHMTVGENLLFGLARSPREERLQTMHEAIVAIGMQGFENRPPHTLSGGQRQRVSLMRSLLSNPAAMLLDEPFNKLDAVLRSQVRTSTFELLRRRGTAAILVTHDEADIPPGGRAFKIESGEIQNA